MDKKINILIVVMVLVLSLSIAYMFLSINMQENKNPPVVNITNNVGTIDQSHYETDYSSDPMDADTEWYLDERPHKQMHSMDEVPSGEREVHYTEDGSGWYEYYD